MQNKLEKFFCQNVFTLCSIIHYGTLYLEIGTSQIFLIYHFITGGKVHHTDYKSTM